MDFACGTSTVKAICRMEGHKEGLISIELVQKILGWKHTGFHVHSQVRAESKNQVERIGKYMIRPLLSLERLSLDEKEGQVIYEVDPLVCPECEGEMRIISFLTD